MSEGIFPGLRIPAPDVNLEAGSRLQGAQTGQILMRIESVLHDLAPDWVVDADTNSTVVIAILESADA